MLGSLYSFTLWFCLGRGPAVHTCAEILRRRGGAKFLLKCHALSPICQTFLVIHFYTYIYVSILNIWYWFVTMEVFVEENSRKLLRRMRFNGSLVVEFLGWRLAKTTFIPFISNQLSYQVSWSNFLQPSQIQTKPHFCNLGHCVSLCYGVKWWVEKDLTCGTYRYRFYFLIKQGVRLATDPAFIQFVEVPATHPRYSVQQPSSLTLTGVTARPLCHQPDPLYGIDPFTCVCTGTASCI